ncbi:MAG: hypothetical protein GY720_07165 [bacterium]|nr:hypothetical protein [bacterium]
MANRTGLVLAGAAARGAYEAGALSELLPALEARNQRPKVLVGTSAGALNAAFLASRAHLGLDVAAKELVDLWKETDRKGMFRFSMLSIPMLVGHELGLNARPSGFLDVGPLEATLNEAIGDWSAIRRNINDGHIDALAVAATATSSGRTVVFVEGGIRRRNGTYRLPESDHKKGIDYVTPYKGIGASHLMASSAVPMLFPPVEIAMSKKRSEWFVDGGLRLNTPIKPAIELGVNRVAIVATDPATHTEPSADEPTVVPDMDDLFLHLLQAALADPLVEDMWRLATINTLLQKPTARKRPIDYVFVGPQRRGELGAIAGQVANEHGLGKLRFLSWLFGRQGTQDQELLSYLLFHPAFFSEAIQRGATDAKHELRRLKAAGREWRTKPMRVS